jgi:hypothetical protein
MRNAKQNHNYAQNIFNNTFTKLVDCFDKNERCSGRTTKICEEIKDKNAILVVYSQYQKNQLMIEGYNDIDIVVIKPDEHFLQRINLLKEYNKPIYFDHYWVEQYFIYYVLEGINEIKQLNIKGI